MSYSIEIVKDEGPVHVGSTGSIGSLLYFESLVTPCSSGTEAVAVEGRRMSAGKVWSKALFDADYFEGLKTVCYRMSRSEAMRGKFPDLLKKWRVE